MKRLITITVAVALGIAIGYIAGRRMPASAECGTETIEQRTDTVADIAPEAVSEAATGTRTYRIALTKTKAASDGQHEIPDSGQCDTVQQIHCGAGAGGKPRCSGDSMDLELPHVQRHYRDSTYEAWVSGPLDPRLDSVRVFRSTTLITRRERASPKRWHIGLTAGYGYTPQGFQPYAGIGLTFSIFSF